MSDEIAKGHRWQAGSGLVALAVLILGMPLALPLTYLAERGVSLTTLEWVSGYFTTLPTQIGYWIGVHGEWLNNAFRSGVVPLTLLAIPGLAVTTLGVGLGLNPYHMLPNTHGSARWASERDVRGMGLLDGFIVVLGQWGGKLLKMPETLSALCIAPPGTGKTVSVVVPTILTCDNACMIVNDVKPELHDITSGYRQTLWPVFKFEWAAQDDPENGIFIPRWNPLSPKCIPPQGAERDLYIDRLSTILVPDPQGSADPHWSKKGRASLCGFVHFIVSKCERGAWDGLPERWRGCEASFPLLLDWITEATLAAGDEIEQMKEVDPNAAMMADPIRQFLMGAVNECRANDYAHRALLELTQLANTPDRERGSILSTMDAGLNIFKNAAVRERTRMSDIGFADLRGMPDPETGEMRPVTVYLCVNQQDARTLGVLTGLFCEALSAYLVAHPPGATSRDGRKMGPFPALFVLDEFPQMPKLQALLDGPAVGRGQKVSYLMIGQDFGQIEEKYSKNGLETLISTTAAKIVLPLNNEVVAKRFSEMVGNKTHESKSRSRTYGFSKQANPFAVNVNKSFSGVPLIHPADFMSMPSGSHVVIFQKYSNRPIKAKTPFYFKDRKLRRRAWNPRQRQGLPPAPAMPPELRIDEG